MPKVRSLNDIKLNLLQPALTSHFEVTIFPPRGVTNKYLKENGVDFNSEKLSLLCSETVLPGSSIATFELNNDYHGSTIRHAHRRLYDDRIDLTFYVSANDYLPIRFFESWIKYIVGESMVGSKDPEGSTRPGSRASNYFYRMNYPDDYIAKGPNNEGGMSVIKFERTGSGGSYIGKELKYQFINTFPIAINSIPVSYDTSSLLKCTISMSYVRYVVLPSSSESDGHVDSKSLTPRSSNFTSTLTPEQLAKLNQFNFDSSVYQKGSEIDFGKYTITGGVDYSAALASGNTIDSRVAFNPKTNLF